MAQTAVMTEDLAQRWRQRLFRLQAQLCDAPRDSGAWHWHAEIRVLRFLVSRYGQLENPKPQASAEVCIVPALDEPTLLHMSALQRALVKMALLSPRVQAKHPRPTERDRDKILSRISQAGDEAREISVAEEQQLKHFDRVNYQAFQARQRGEQQREREKRWKENLRLREKQWTRELRERNEQERARRQ